MGGGARYPYPKHVWSPAGGWWARPSNWKTNTAITAGGIAAIVLATWNISKDKEWRDVEPSKPIPSMNWTKQYKDRAKSSDS
ncbi:hypothetical protein PUNSTDRAFT_81119 [Punctularia strigosozonata HHB-11173 SS5]|uniref:uncharacterized protein n=1 Tax=Punctularia strigosozonata (strain HHB-11173) TaxID=741275 RepID=UPI0004416C18|nr:uncharacterized protein PUNSTDRAFT_81119 [Punctularia strigosozonata HHB-11173 SS5]EIN14631.1 hypothetical protein PUNSTDRAFT_81119 [Punctularia strigosozonata HHB-11173 SS5]